MKVKELITRLLDEPMDAEIYVGNRERHIDERGDGCGRIIRYMFEIDGVERWDENCCSINFTDWRKVCGVKDESEVIVNDSEKPNNLERSSE